MSNVIGGVMTPPYEATQVYSYFTDPHQPFMIQQNLGENHYES